MTVKTVHYTCLVYSSSVWPLLLWFLCGSIYTTGPANPQPPEQDPADLRPLDQEPSDQDPADPQTRDQDPTDTQPHHQDAADFQPPDQDPADPQPPNQDPADPQHPDQDAADPQPPGQDPADPQSPGQDPADSQPRDQDPADLVPDDEHNQVSPKFYIATDYDRVRILEDFMGAEDFSLYSSLCLIRYGQDFPKWTGVFGLWQVLKIHPWMIF